MAKRFALEHPDTNAGYSFRVSPLRRHLVADFGRSLTILLMAVGGLLLIACANVSNLMLARAAFRRNVASWPDVRVQPTILMSHLQDPVPVMALVVRSKLPESAVAASIRTTVARIDPEQPVRPVRLLNDVLSSGLAQRRFLALLLEGFSLLGLALAASGSYSVVSYLMERRRREIGIRTALGAQTVDILALFVGRAVGWAIFGTLLGAASAVGLAHLLKSQVYGVSPTEPHILATIAGLLILTSALAAYLPARRSARIDPLLALRSE